MKRTHYPKGKKQRKKDCPWLICWVDARGFLSQTWWFKEDRKYIQQTAERVLTTVGWCIDKTKSALIFAGSRDRSLDDTFAHGEVVSIPKGCILSMRRLK